MNSATLTLEPGSSRGGGRGGKHVQNILRNNIVFQLYHLFTNHFATLTLAREFHIKNEKTYFT